ncbi:MAG: hypothetical protein QG564_488 [Campylobacterota bacterium]|nr:hypothetical protein [Campylobacterota bacterium]
MIFFIVIGFALFFWLLSGIQFDELTFGEYKVKKLYIKLDKKLTFKAEELDIPISKAKPSLENIDKAFDNIKSLFAFFEYLELEKVHFKNNTLKIAFANDTLYIASDDYEIVGNIDKRGYRVIVDISLLYLKKNDASITGKLIYDFKKDRVQTQGNFDAYHIKGEFNASKERDQLRFSIKSDPFTDIKTFVDTLTLGEAVRSWIVEKVEAKEYQLLSLEGKAKINHGGTLKIDFDALRGEMWFDDAKVHYKQGLPPAVAKGFLLSYKKGALHFDFKEPFYEQRSLEGSTVDIAHLTQKKSKLLYLDLRLHTPFDNVVQEILQAYGFHVPVIQKSGDAKATLKAKIDLTQKKKDFIFDAELKKGVVEVAGLALPVIKGKVHYGKNVVNLKKVYLKDAWYEGEVEGEIKLKEKTASLLLDAKQVKIGKEEEPFLFLKDQKLPFEIDYRDKLKVTVPKLGMTLQKRAKDTLITLKDLKKIKPFLINKSIVEDGGTLDIWSSDFENYQFKGELLREACFFYDKDNACHIKVPYSGKIEKNNMDFYAFDKRLHWNVNTSRIDLSNLNIDLKKFLEARRQQTKETIKKLVILGKQSNFRYGKYTLVTDTYDIEVMPNGTVKATGSSDGDIIKFNKEGKKITLQALRIKDAALHPLIHFDGLKEGRYSLKQSGDLDKEMKGQMIIEGGVLSDFKAYSHILAFLNTVPALATLNNPGFSKKGFTIKKGIMEYRILGDTIMFDSVFIQGKSATIAGKGTINMKQKTIHIDLAIQTARELGKFLGNIPVLGYIMMGEDKSMTVGLKVTGTLDEPKIRTTAAEDILLMPIQFLKRMIKTPESMMKE